MKIRLDAKPLRRVRAELVAIVVPSDGLRALGREPAAGAAIAREVTRRRFKAEVGSSILMPSGGRGARRQIAIVGLGPSASAGRDAYRRAGFQIVQRAREARAATAAVAVLKPPAEQDLLGALAEGAALASYAFDTYRRDPERVALRSLTMAGVAAAARREARRAVTEGEALAHATNLARRWINEPAAVMTPATLAEEAVRAARAAGLEARADGPAAIARLQMRALLAVSAGSDQQPRFIRVTYKPRADTTPVRRLALVGKGITFDSGGLSLKSTAGMEHMKRDMAGGAAVLGAMIAIAAIRPAIEVRAYVPASENMPGDGAMKPGDVVRTASGRTVEILNTDAEGRLVLADALAIAVRDQPDAIVDVATLTGAVRSALGGRIGGIMGNDPALVKALIEAGNDTGERLWELPLVAAYRPNIDSTIADLRNVSLEPHGGAIHAGLFLQEFASGRPWAHLDIAGVAFTDRDLPGSPRGATGFAVRLLTRWVCSLANG
jgi:leucyl aminopeptidase